MKLKLIAFSGAILLQVSGLQAEPVVIGNSSIATTLSSSDVKNIFLGKRKALPSGDKVELIEQPEDSELRDKFHSKFTGKTQSQLNAYRARLIFTGKGSQPRTVNNSKELIDIVSKDPSIIGYIDSSEVTPDIAILAK